MGSSGQTAPSRANAQPLSISNWRPCQRLAPCNLLRAGGAGEILRYRRARRSSTLSRRFAASSPLVGRGGSRRLRAGDGGGIPAYAGMTVMGAGGEGGGMGRFPLSREWIIPSPYKGRGLGRGYSWGGRGGRARSSRRIAPSAGGVLPVPSPAAFAGSSPIIGRGGSGACAPPIGRAPQWGRESRLRGNDGHGVGGAGEGSQPFFPRNSKAMRI